MIIKNIAKFRAEIKRKTRNDYPDHNSDFVGYEALDGTMGFFKFYNGLTNGNDGIKDKIQPTLQNAEDEQAIYEFIQNAADCKSESVYVFYNETYFLVINNGHPFTEKDVTSILAQFAGSKRQESELDNKQNIGRYGIGFKLVHRLVGQEDGASELINNYSGPVIFSWQEREQLYDFLNNSKEITHAEIPSNSFPWLFKILITCFPTAPGEEIYDINFNKTVRFTLDELRSFQDFVKLNVKNINLDHLSQGSMFFLKFGENKSKKLNDSLRNLERGLEYSMNMLRSIKYIQINTDISITGKNITKHEFQIQPNEEIFSQINPEFKNFPIELTIGYPDTTDEILELLKSPNFYQFFPLGDEIHSLGFIVHSTSFIKETNRRKLSENSDTNRLTFQYLAKKILQLLKEFIINNNYLEYSNLYKSILLSDRSKRQNSNLITEFYDSFLPFIRDNIPTNINKVGDKIYVKEKKTKLSLISPQDFGVNSIGWFYWSDDAEVLSSARNNAKLGLTGYNLQDLILNTTDTSQIGSWITNNASEYELFLDELNESIGDNETFLNNLLAIPFIKYGNTYITINSINNNVNVIPLTEENIYLKEAFEAIGFKCININYSNHSNIAECLGNNIICISDKNIFYEIVIRKLKNQSILNSIDSVHKIAIINYFISQSEILREKISSLNIVKSESGSFFALKELINPNIPDLPILLNAYKISSTDYSEEFNSILISEEEIYHKLIHFRWNSITEFINATNIKSLYETTIRYYSISVQKIPLPSDCSFIYFHNSRGTCYFMTEEAAFYNAKLNENNSNDYEGLRNLIFKLTGLGLPHLDGLIYLNIEPFVIKEQILTDQMVKLPKTWELNLTEIKLLLNYFESNNSPFFNLFVIEHGLNNHYNISVKGSNKFQYFTKNLKKIQYINENLTNILYLLPLELFNSKNYNHGLIIDKNLDEIILKESDYNSQLLDIVIEMDSRDLQIQYILNYPTFIINPYEVYDSKSEINRLFKLSYDALGRDEEQFELFRQKIFILIDGSQHPISEIAVNNIVKFNIEENIFELRLSSIISEYTERGEIVSILLQHFPGIEDYALEKIIFKIGRQKGYQSIWNELNKKYSNKTLDTAEQIAFVYLYCKKNNEIFGKSSILIETLGGHINIFSKSILYLKKHDYVLPENILHSKYQKLQLLLNISERNAHFNYFSNYKILYDTYFDGNEFICCPISRELLNTNHIKSKAFLDDCYTKWKVIKPALIHFPKLQFDRNNQGLYNCDLENLIGFNINLFVYSDLYSLIEERLPTWVSDWIMNDKDSKLEFLSALGLNQKVISIRECFAEKNKYLDHTIAKELNERGNNSIQSTLKWLALNNILFTTIEHQQITNLEFLFSLIEFRENTPLLIIKEISVDTNLITYKLTTYTGANKIFLINLKETLPISPHKLLGIINQKNDLLVDESIVPENFLSKIQATKIEILKAIDLIKGKENSKPFYNEWKKEINEAFKIFEFNGAICYVYAFEDALIETNSANDFDIVNGVIAYNKEIYDNIEKVGFELKKLIGANKFELYHYESFVHHIQQEPEIIETKLTNELLDDFSKIETFSSKDFPEGEIISFGSKLIELLNKQNSKWKGFIYHFAHVENVISILAEQSIKSRNSASFKDSAGQELIARTKDAVKDFARFYFRPKTPTQWHNEGLGKRRLESNPKCPVMIFLRFKIDEVLNKYPNKCYISNGNLSTNWARYDNTYEFLKSFDYNNVYKDIYETTDIYTYLRASQQEFVVANEFNFNDLEHFEIICKSDQDKETLISLLSKTSNFSENILVDSSFYYNENPSINIIEEEGALFVKNPKVSTASMLNVVLDKMECLIEFKSNILSIRKNDNYEMLCDSDVKLELRGETKFKIFYLENNEKWLVYSK